MDTVLEKKLAEAGRALREAGATEVFVFGSAASGDLRRHSDIDLAVSGLPPARFFRAISIAWDILGRPVDLLDLDRPTPRADYLKRKGDLHRVG